jgi:hypothetical protein
VSDTITLVAGVLLTSVGLLALLPFVIRLGRRSRDRQTLQLDPGFLPALAAADALMRPDSTLLQSRTAAAPADVEVLNSTPEEPSSVNDDVEELMAHLFSLRMTVSEITAEVQDVHEAIFGEAPDAALSEDVVESEYAA